LKVAVENLGVDFQKAPERAAHRVMDQDLRHTELRTYRRNGGVELRLIGYIARVGTRARDFSL
jgi:hypothetical protein